MFHLYMLLLNLLRRVLIWIDGWTLVKNLGIFHFKERFQMQMILYTEVHRYWIMNERDSTLEALLLVSNKPKRQSFDWRSNGREHLPVTQTKLLCREGLLCTGVRDDKCSREYAEIKFFFFKYIYYHHHMPQFALLPITKVMIQDDWNRHFVNMRYFFFLVRTTICVIFLPPNIVYS